MAATYCGGHTFLNYYINTYLFSYIYEKIHVILNLIFDQLHHEMPLDSVEGLRCFKF